jgi:hypothetical protein
VYDDALITEFEVFSTHPFTGFVGVSFLPLQRFSYKR